MNYNEFQLLLSKLAENNTTTTEIPTCYSFTRCLLAAKIISRDESQWNSEIGQLILAPPPEQLSLNHEIAIHDLKQRFPKHKEQLAQITYDFADMFVSDERARQIVLVVSFCYKMYVLDMQRYQKEYKISRELRETAVVEELELQTPVVEPDWGNGVQFLTQFTATALHALVHHLLHLERQNALAAAQRVDEQLWAQMVKTGVLGGQKLRLLDQFFIDALPDRFLLRLFPLALRFNAFTAALFSALRVLLKDSFVKFSSAELQEQLLNSTLCEALRTVGEADFTEILCQAVAACGGTLVREEPVEVDFVDCSESVVKSLTAHQASQQLDQMRLFHYLIVKEMESAADIVKTGFVDQLKAGRPISREKREILVTDLKRLRSVIASILPCNAAEMRKEYFVSGDDGYFVACQAVIEMFSDICAENQFLRKLRE